MAYKIEAHMIDEEAEAVTVTVTAWGEDRKEAQEVFDAVREGFPDLNAALADETAVLEEGECADEERPEVEIEEGEEVGEE